MRLKNQLKSKQHNLTQVTQRLRLNSYNATHSTCVTILTCTTNSFLLNNYVIIKWECMLKHKFYSCFKFKCNFWRKTSQESRMIPPVTLNWGVTMNVGTVVFNCQNCHQLSQGVTSCKGHKSLGSLCGCVLNNGLTNTHSHTDKVTWLHRGVWGQLKIYCFLKEGKWNCGDIKPNYVEIWNQILWWEGGKIVGKKLDNMSSCRYEKCAACQKTKILI